MTDPDGRRRPGLAGWLTDKVEGLASGRTRGMGPSGPSPTPAPDPAQQRQAAELQRLEEDRTRLAKELDHAQVMLMGKEAEFKNDLQELQERNAELLDKIVKLTQRDRELQAKIVEAKFEGTGAQDQAKKLDMDLRDLRRVAKAKDAELSALKTELAQLKKDTAGAPDAAQTATETEALTRRLQKALADARALTTERDALRTRLDKAGAQQAELDKGLGDPTTAANTNDEATDDKPLAGVPGHVATDKNPEVAKAQAAGKLPAVAQALYEGRQRRGAAAQRLLDAEDPGFATLPEGFVATLLERAPKRRSKKHSSGKQAQGDRRDRRGSPQRKGRGKGNRGRRRGPGNGQAG